MYEHRTASNAGTLLLRLPQEIKDQIYESAFGGEFIHVRCSWSSEDGREFYCLQYKAESIEKEAHNMFARSVESCFPGIDLQVHDSWFSSHPPGASELHTRLAQSSCCRQIHQEARSIIFSANTWSFNNPFCFLDFFATRPHIDTPLNTSLIRRLRLDILTGYEPDENLWNDAFPVISQKLKSLRYLHISINQYEEGVRFPKQWQFNKTPAECCYLQEIRSLRDLRLRAVTVVVCGCERDIDDDPYRWTAVQRQEWAGYITRVLLCQED